MGGGGGEMVDRFITQCHTQQCVHYTSKATSSCERDHCVYTYRVLFCAYVMDEERKATVSHTAGQG